MFRNIQRYLLLNFPLLWNIKLFPVLLIAIVGNIILFIYGYTTEKVNFKINQYDDLGNYFLIYFVIAILIIMFIIVWLVNYSKNNMFKSYYPFNANKLYLEWILIFLSVFSILLFPYSFNRGSNLKIRSYASVNDLSHAFNILNAITILMPTEDSKLDYFLEKPNEQARSYRQYNMSMKHPDQTEYNNYVNIDSVFDNQQTYLDSQYPNFRQFSLLNYLTFYNDGIVFDLDSSTIKSSHIENSIINYDTIKYWLVTGQTQSIKKLMSAYLSLEEKRGFKSNISVDTWLSKIYNPPTFEVNNTNLFKINSYYGRNFINSDSFSVDYLKGAYNKIDAAYRDNGYILFLSMLNIALGMSMLIFSFRVTSGKAWLISMIYFGVVNLFFIVITLIFGFINNDSDLQFTIFCILIIFLFIVELSILFFTKTKGKTSVLLNNLINLLPLIPLVLVTIISLSASNDTQSYLKDNLTTIIVSNVLLTFITMYFLNRFLIIRWKGLPEE